ncbi:MAG: CHAP domain-containing protein [Sphingomonadaceae bacterium]
MKRLLLVLGATICLSLSPAGARIALDDDSAITGGGASSLPPYLQCVPYARQVSGIQIRGDAWTWWDQAEGRYARGFVPRVGAVMALKPHGNSRLGHVAAVSKVIDSRTILIRHSNWSPINGRRGQIEDNVKAIDVSDANDWSAVRIWYAPIQALGGSHWPVQGFIYPKKPGKKEAQVRQPLPEWPEAPKLAKSAKPAKAAKASKDPIGEIIARKMRW